MSAPWYDRNPKSKAGRFFDKKTPHSEVKHLEYIVPTGKIAVIDLLQVGVFRTDVDSAPDWARAYFIIGPKIGTFMHFVAQIKTNTVGDRDDDHVGGILLFEGDALRGYTYDDGADGGVFYHLSYKLTELDGIPYVAPPEAAPPDIQEPEVAKDPRM